MEGEGETGERDSRSRVSEKLENIKQKEVGQIRRKPGEVRRRIALTREETCETVGACLETNDVREKALEDLNSTTQLKLVTQMKNKKGKRLGKRSIEEEKKTDRDQGKKKRGEEEERIEIEREEVEEISMDIDSEVSKEKDDNDKVTISKDKEGNKKKK